MKRLKISVIDKIAQSIDAVIVCGNDDYVIEFMFDAEWENQNKKTARFCYNGIVEDIVFTGNSVAVPRLRNVTTLAVGVYAGDLQTTTPALISCKKSILCQDGLPPDPTPDVYAQIMGLLNNGGLDGFSPVVKVTENENGHSVRITDINGDHIFEVTNGKDGKDGENGKDGYTPQKGVDYYTEADKSEIVTDVINALPKWNGGAY